MDECGDRSRVCERSFGGARGVYEHWFGGVRFWFGGARLSTDLFPSQLPFDGVGLLQKTSFENIHCQCWV
jgi:hypothetical protein